MLPQISRVMRCWTGATIIKLPRRSALLVGLVLGAAIWLLSPLATGQREPWDAEGPYYLAALFGSGVLSGLLAPHHWVGAAFGIFGGQALVLLAGVVTDPSSGGLWPLGLVFLAFYSAVALVGAVLGAGARQWGAPSMKSREPDKD